MAHPACFKAAQVAGQKIGLTGDFLILLEESNAPLPCATPTIEQLITFGSSKPETFKPLRLKPGEAKTTLAFLSFSSGTTGKSMLSSDYDKFTTLPTGKPKVLISNNVNNPFLLSFRPWLYPIMGLSQMWFKWLVTTG